MPLTGSVISVTAETTTTISLSVTAPGNGVGPYSYQWSRSLVSGSGYSNVGTNSTTLADTGLTPGTQYYYQVLVTDSTPVTPLTGTFGPAAAVTNPLVGEGEKVTAITNTSISLLASVPSDGTAPFTVQWQKSTDGVTYANIGGATSLAVTDSGLVSGKKYWYQAVFTDANGAVGTTTPILVRTYHQQRGTEGIVRKEHMVELGRISGPPRRR